MLSKQEAQHLIGQMFKQSDPADFLHALLDYCHDRATHKLPWLLELMQGSAYEQEWVDPYAFPDCQVRGLTSTTKHDKRRVGSSFATLRARRLDLRAGKGEGPGRAAVRHAQRPHPRLTGQQPGGVYGQRGLRREGG